MWSAADASYEHKSGWSFAAKSFDRWEVETPDALLGLELQKNGQIGVFPEHLGYLDELRACVAGRDEPQVLNLFAYTGLATIVCAKAGARVTHVDIAKRVLDWAGSNLERNAVPKDRVRFIREDARTFVAKELRREKYYSAIIADPPGFSRVSERDTWQLEEVLRELIDGCVRLLDPKGGTIFFSSHYYEFGEMVIVNLLRDAFERAGRKGGAVHLDGRQLSLIDHSAGRRLPAGFLVVARAPG
jgi:23S rRNA (cytosine1962-C5)-methyltransferase